MKSATILVGILLVIGVSCHHKNFPEELKQGIISCAEELNISEDEHMEAVENHDFSNPKFHCMPECVMRVSGLMVDKEVNVERLKKIMNDMQPEIPNDQVETLNKKCFGEAKSKEDKCDHAMAYQMCMENSFGME